MTLKYVFIPICHCFGFPDMIQEGSVLTPMTPPGSTPVTADKTIWCPGGMSDLSIDMQQLLLGVSAASMLIPERL